MYNYVDLCLDLDNSGKKEYLFYACGQHKADEYRVAGMGRKIPAPEP